MIGQLTHDGFTYSADYPQIAWRTCDGCGHEALCMDGYACPVPGGWHPEWGKPEPGDGPPCEGCTPVITLYGSCGPSPWPELWWRACPGQGCTGNCDCGGGADGV